MSKWEVFGRLVISTLVLIAFAYLLGSIEDNPNHIDLTGQIWSAFVAGIIAALMVLFVMTVAVD